MRTLFKLATMLSLVFVIYFSLPSYKKDASPKRGRFAYVVLNSNKKSLFATIVLFYQLRKHRCNWGDYVVLAPASLQSYIVQFEEILGIKTITYDDNTPLFEPKYTVASSSTTVRDRILWQKLRAWELIDYDRVIMLDNDLLIRGNIDHLFLTRNVSGVPAVYDNEKILFWDPKNLTSLVKVSHIEKGVDGLNSGVLVLSPNKADFQELVEAASQYTNRTCCPTQEFIFRHFESKGLFNRLSYKYNMRKFHRRPDIDIKSVLIYHFVERRKPLHIGPKMSVDAMSKEWWENAVEFIDYMKHKCKDQSAAELCESFEEVKRVALTFEYENES